LNKKTEINNDTVVLYLSYVSRKDRNTILKNTLSLLSEKERYNFIKTCLYAVYPKIKWDRMKKWMEGQFSKNFEMKPIAVARMAVRYYNTGTSFLPFLIVTARRAKDRVRKRMEKEKDKNVF